MQSTHTPCNSASHQQLTGRMPVSLPSFYDKHVIGGYDTFAAAEKHASQSNVMIHRYFGSSETESNSVVSRPDPRILYNVPSSPSDFISSPASDSSAEEELGILSKTIKPKTLASSTNSAAQTTRPSQLCATPTSSNVDLESLSSSAVSTPAASSEPISLRRSMRKRTPSSKHETKDEAHETGPATRLRPRRKLTALEKKEAQDLKDKGPNFCQWIPEIAIYPARPDFGEMELDEENEGFYGNRTNSIPESKDEVVAKWTDEEQKRFLASYLRHGKTWNLVGPTCKKTTKQCVEYYYYTKHSFKFRQAKAMRKEYLERVGKLHCIQKDTRHVQYLLKKSIPEPGHKKGRKKKSGR